MKTNLDAGRIRMLFIADRIPPELRLVVEFLNAQMEPAEVLAIELRQYQGENMRALVPLVIGQSERALQKKGAARGPKREWDEESLLQDIDRRRGDAVRRRAEVLISWMKKSGGRVQYGAGQQDGSVGAYFDVGEGKEVCPFRLYSYGRVEIQFQHMIGRGVFDAEEKRRELLNKLNAIDGVAISTDELTTRPPIPLTILEGAKLDRFISTMDWFVTELKQV